MRLAKIMREIGDIPFEMEIPLYIIVMFVYMVLIPIWLPVYLVARIIEIYTEDLN